MGISSIAIIIFYLFSIIFVVAIPICIGVFVYRDAQKSNLNPIMWTLIAVLVPGYIGLIAYLIVRNQTAKMACPSCNAPIRPEFIKCPSCGTSLKSNCTNCNSPVEANWRLCPNCGAEIPEELRNSIPVIQQNKKLPTGLLLVIIVPLVAIIVSLFLFLCFGFLFRMSEVKISSPTEITHQQKEADIKLFELQ